MPLRSFSSQHHKTGTRSPRTHSAASLFPALLLRPHPSSRENTGVFWTGASTCVGLSKCDPDSDEPARQRWMAAKQEGSRNREQTEWDGSTHRAAHRVGVAQTSRAEKPRRLLAQIGWDLMYAWMHGSLCTHAQSCRISDLINPDFFSPPSLSFSPTLP